MILYFSGTGNSHYIAEKIAEINNDDVVSLNHLIKSYKTDMIISKERPFVFVCPTYAWRLPRIVDAFIRKTSFNGNTEVYFIMTCGGETANAIHHIKKLCRYKGWELKGFAEIKMPDNYTAMFPGSETSVAKDFIKKAEPTINRIATDIQNRKSFTIMKDKGFYGKLESGIINSLFYTFFVHTKGFHIIDKKCVSCGKCVKLCPLNNIILSDDKPVWANNCTHCMACINGCPTQAIEYKNSTQNKPRYFLDNIGKRLE
jgi:ferredoxin